MFGFFDFVYFLYKVEKLNLKFFLSFNINMINIVLGGDERIVMCFKKESSVFLNFIDSLLYYISVFDLRFLFIIVGWILDLVEFKFIYIKN